MDDDLDQLLRRELLLAPADFTERVMQGIKPLPLPIAPQPPGRRNRLVLRRWAVRVVMTATGLLGLSQVLSFVFGVWLATTAF